MDLYCKRCGRVLHKAPNDKNRICDVCNFNSMELVPEKYWYTPTDDFLSKDSMYLLREELVKTSPEYDEYLFNNRDKIQQQKSAEYNRVSANIKFDSNGRAYYAGGSPNQPKCPTCNSTNIKSISTLNRMTSVGLFGLSSGKIGKTKQCKNCGYTW